VPGNVPGVQIRPGSRYCNYNTNKYLILLVGIVGTIVSLEFDADGIVIAAGRAAEDRLASVPGTPVERHKLHYLAIPPNKQVSAHLQATNCGIVWVRIPIEFVEEQLLDLRSSEFAWRQADSVYYNHSRNKLVRPRILIR